MHCTASWQKGYWGHTDHNMKADLTYIFWIFFTENTYKCNFLPWGGLGSLGPPTAWALTRLRPWLKQLQLWFNLVPTRLFSVVKDDHQLVLVVILHFRHLARFRLETSDVVDSTNKLQKIFPVVEFVWKSLNVHEIRTWGNPEPEVRDPGRSLDPLRDLAIPDSKEVSAMAANMSLANE